MNMVLVPIYVTVLTAHLRAMLSAPPLAAFPFPASEEASFPFRRSLNIGLAVMSEVLRCTAL